MELLTTGRGPAQLLLIPGNDLDAHFYLPLAEALAARQLSCTLVTPPGRADVPAPANASWSGLLDALEPLVGPVLMGHSLGALAALLLAARRPPALERLILLEPAIFVRRAFAKVAARRYLRNVVRSEDLEFDNHRGGLRRIARLDRFPSAALERYASVRARSDQAFTATLFETLPDLYPLPFDRIEAATHIIRGEQTGRAGAWMVQQLAAQIPGTQVTAIDGAAHWLANEADDAVADAIVRFCGAPAVGTQPS